MGTWHVLLPHSLAVLNWIDRGWDACWNATTAWSNQNHTDSHRVFIELSFGINSVLAFYKDLSDAVRKPAQARVQSHVSQLVACAQDDPGMAIDSSRVTVLAKSAQCDRWQKPIDATAFFCAKLGAVLAALALYIDVIEWLDWKCIFFMLPLPLFWLALHLNYGRCVRLCKKESKRLAIAMSYRLALPF